MGRVVAKLPPLREVNHRIPLVDEGKQYAYHLPRCPDSLKPQLAEKIQLYTNAKWWIMASCQVRVYSGRGSGQVRTKADEGREQRAGQEVSPAGVGDRLDSMTKDNER